MAFAVDSSAPVKIVQNVESPTTRTIRNDGPDSCSLSRDPGLTAAGADVFVVASGASQLVTLAAGEELYAICAATKSASLEVI